MTNKELVLEISKMKKHLEVADKLQAEMKDALISFKAANEIMRDEINEQRKRQKDVESCLLDIKAILEKKPNKNRIEVDDIIDQEALTSVSRELKHIIEAIDVIHVKLKNLVK